MNTSHDLIVHSHFYQPPRENPWTDEIDPEESAAPFANWNERITSECYRANAFARVLENGDRIAELVNTYRFLNFDFGPTLVRWLARSHPAVLARVKEADEASVLDHGHGNAIAQAYNHIILPLALRRDRLTQIRWGLSEFRHRFGRDAEAMWCPETAVNDDVLGELLDHGMRYVILAPRQARRIRESSTAPWQDAAHGGLDTSRAYRWVHPDASGRWLAVFFYHPGFAMQISFGDALKSTDNMLERCREAAGEIDPHRRKLVHAAADGESAGHHTAWGDRVLAHALARRAPSEGFSVTNYASFLVQEPPVWEVELELGPDGEGSAWSCAHGVGRWIRDCGCRVSSKGGNQTWRAPLRQALDLLRDRAAPFFETRARPLLRDPWAARDAYVQLLLDPSAAHRDAFLGEHAAHPLTDDEQIEAASLLELQHQLLLMYTSCGWFFDDIAGLEPVQILRYAARALELWEELGGTAPREEFEGILAQAHSNDALEGDGRQIFHRRALTARVTAETVALHLLTEHATLGRPARGRALLHEFDVEHVRISRGSVGVVATAIVRLRHERTGSRRSFCVALWHRGGSTVTGCVSDPRPALDFTARQDAVHAAADNGGLDALQADFQTWFGAAPVAFEGIASRRQALWRGWLRRLLTAHGGWGEEDASQVLSSLLERATAGGGHDPSLVQAALDLLDLTAKLEISLDLEPAQNVWFQRLRSDEGQGARRLGARLGFVVPASGTQRALPSRP